MLITIRTSKQLICMPLEDIKVVLNENLKKPKASIHSIKNNENLGSLVRIYGMDQDKFIEYISSHPEQYELIDKKTNTQKQ